MKENCCPNGCPPNLCGECKKRNQDSVSVFPLSLKEIADEILAKSLPPVIIRREKVGLPDFAGEILNKNKGGL